MNESIYIIGAIASVLGLLIVFLGKDYLIDSLRLIARPIAVTKIMRDGINNFYDSRFSLLKRNDGKIYNYLSHAQKEIGIIALSLNAYIVNQNLHKDLVRALLLNNNLVINIYLLDPNSDILSKLEGASGWNKEDLKRSINQSILMLKEESKSLREEDLKRLNLFTYDAVIPSWVIAIDPELKKSGEFLVENHVYGFPIDQRYLFEIKRPGSKMYNTFKESYIFFKNSTHNKKIDLTVINPTGDDTSLLHDSST